MIEVRDRFEKAFVKSKLQIEDVADLIGVSVPQATAWVEGAVPNWINAIPLVRFINTIERCEADDGLSDSPTVPKWYKIWWTESASEFDSHDLLIGWSKLAKMMSDMGVTCKEAAPWINMNPKQMNDLVRSRKVSPIYYDPLLKFALALKVIHDRGGFVEGQMNEAEFRPVWDKIRKLDLPSRQLAREQKISNTLAAGKNN